MCWNFWSLQIALRSWRTFRNLQMAPVPTTGSRQKHTHRKRRSISVLHSSWNCQRRFTNYNTHQLSKSTNFITNISMCFTKLRGQNPVHVFEAQGTEWSFLEWLQSVVGPTGDEAIRWFSVILQAPIQPTVTPREVWQRAPDKRWVENDPFLLGI